MPSLFRRLYHGVLAASIGLAFAGCVTMSPSIRACHADPARAQTDHSSRLRILPSQVPGLVLDSARWFSLSGTEDLGVHTNVVFVARMHATVSVRVDSVAIVYRGANAGMPMLIGGADQPPIYTATQQSTWTERLPNRLGAGTSQSTEHVMSQSTGLPTNTDWIRDCPATAQAIWRRDIPLAFGLDEQAARRVERLPNASSLKEDPVRIVGDTIIEFRGDYAIQAFAAVVIQNTSGQPTEGVTLAFLTEQRKPIRDGGFTTPEAITRRDSVGTLAPGERRTILGPLVNGGDYAYSARYVGAVVASEGPGASSCGD